MLTLDLSQSEKAESVEGLLRQKLPMSRSTQVVLIVNWCWWSQTTEGYISSYTGSSALHMYLPKYEQASQQAIVLHGFCLSSYTMTSLNGKLWSLTWNEPFIPLSSFRAWCLHNSRRNLLPILIITSVQWIVISVFLFSKRLTNHKSGNVLLLNIVLLLFTFYRLLFYFTSS